MSICYQNQSPQSTHTGKINFIFPNGLLTFWSKLLYSPKRTLPENLFYNRLSERLIQRSFFFRLSVDLKENGLNTY